MTKSTQSYFARALKMRTSFRSPGHEAMIALIRTASCMKNGLEKAARREGISLSQFNILRILRGADGPLPTMEVGSRMVELEPGVTRLMTKLQAGGFVRRWRSDSDARVVVCEISDSGRALLDRLDGAIAAFEEEVMAALPPEDLRRLTELLAVLHCRTLPAE